MRPVLVFLSASVLLGPAALHAETRYYRSNAVGMALSRLDGPAVSGYVLVVEAAPEVETRSLLENQETRRVWKTTLAGGIRTVEEHGPEGLEKRESFDAEGRLSRRQRYDSDGLVAESEFRYEGGRLVWARNRSTRDGHGESTDDYRYDRQGNLVEVRRRAAGEVESAAFRGGVRGEAVWEAQVGAASETVVVLDDSGRPWTRTHWRDGRRTLIVTNRYDEGRLAEVRTDYPLENRVRIQEFDSKARAVDTKDYLGTRLVERRRDSYSGEYLVQRVVENRDGELKIDYEYDSAGILRLETHSRGDRLVRRIVYLDEARRYEELFRGGNAYLRVHFIGEERVRDELVKRESTTPPAGTASSGFR